MDLYLAIKQIYPDLIDDKDFILKNDGKGSETYIYKWNTELPQPTEEELQEAYSLVQIPPDPLEQPSDVDKLREENVQLKTELETVKSVLDFIIMNY